ncbi:MAG: histidine phosphatase family protein [Anaerolineales bacterium]|nr:histidine phosphatase family protein [Anaerolineales bacterium]
MSTELILIRHGNAVRVNGDYFHAPLTSLGQEQAAQTGQYFSAPENHLDGFYSSPLRRTQETAKIIGAKIGLDPELRPGVQEVMFFETPALVIIEILSIFDPVENYLNARVGRSIRWPIVGRVSAVLLDILTKHPDQRVAVVAHAGVISASLSWYLPEKRWRWWRTTVSNCSLTRFKVEGNRAELLAVNDVRHLSPVIVTTQPPTVTVEVAKEVHPAEKALVFEKPSETDEK